MCAGIYRHGSILRCFEETRLHEVVDKENFEISTLAMQTRCSPSELLAHKSGIYILEYLLAIRSDVPSASVAGA